MSNGIKRTRNTSVSDAVCCNSQQDDAPPNKKQKRPMPGSRVPVKDQMDYCPINILSEELMTRIFSFLEVEDKAMVAGVCRQWKDALYHTSLWMDINAKLHLNSLDYVVFDSLKTRGIKQVTVLDRCKPDKLQLLVTTLSDVEMLSLEKCLLTKQQLESLFSGSTLLHVKRLHLRCDGLDSISIICALERLDHLQHLELKALCPRYLFSIIGVLNKVRHLTVSVESQRLSDAPRVSGHMPCMRELILRKVKVDDSVLLYLKRTFPNLEKLDVGLDDGVTLEGVQHLAQMTQLKRLYLHSWKCPAEWMNHLREGLTELQVLELYDYFLSFKGLMTMTELPSLRDLTVQTLNFTDTEYRTLLKGCGNLTRFALDLYDTGPPLTIFCFMPRLEEVCLNCSWGLEDGHMQALCDAFRSLTKLVLKKTLFLTNDSLKHVAKVPTLQSLVVSDNRESISGRGLEYLQMGRAHLQDLGLLQLSKVEDADIKKLKGLKSLRRLQVFECGVSDKALIDCVMGLPRLQVLESDISQESKRQLRRMRPGLTVRILTDFPCLWRRQ